VETAKDGTYRIETAMPGGKVPSIDVAIFARGLLKPLRTRVYLAPEPRVRAEPVLKALENPARVKTLIAVAAGESEFRWDVRLQGEGETVFFAA
jgi:protocatechuate 3,4-dioxygenase alpha subunit